MHPAALCRTLYSSIRYLEKTPKTCFLRISAFSSQTSSKMKHDLDKKKFMFRSMFFIQPSVDLAFFINAHDVWRIPLQYIFMQNQSCFTYEPLHLYSGSHYNSEDSTVRHKITFWLFCDIYFYYTLLSSEPDLLFVQNMMLQNLTETKLCLT